MICKKRLKRGCKQQHLPDQHQWQSIQQTNKTYSAALESAKANSEETEAAGGIFHAITTGITAGWTAAIAVEQCELVRLRNTSTARKKT